MCKLSDLLQGSLEPGLGICVAGDGCQCPCYEDLKKDTKYFDNCTNEIRNQSMMVT
jgi:hypothetical protein